MLERGFGRIINIGSDAGRVGSSLEAVYSGAAAAIQLRIAAHIRAQATPFGRIPIRPSMQGRRAAALPRGRHAGVSIRPPPIRSSALLIVTALPPTRLPGFSGLVCGLFLLLEDQPADLEVQLLGVGEVIDVAQRLILAR
jgi:hypothetical protein